MSAVAGRAAPSESPRDRRFGARDYMRMGSPGWFPVTSDPVLEELRAEHERLLVRRDEAQQQVAGVRARFEAQDAARQAEFDAAAREVREPELPDRTGEDDRRDAIMDAEARLRAASHALAAFGTAAVDRLRGELPEGWHAAEAVNEHRIPPNGAAAEIVAKLDVAATQARERMEQARRALAEADRELRAVIPLRVWLIRTANAGTDGTARLEPADGLEVPPAFTAGTKPRDLDVPGWFPDATGTPEPEEGAEPVDTSDPWFAERERITDDDSIATREF
jgi:hypothetical protein